MPEDIVALANEAQPHLAVINDFMVRSRTNPTFTSDEYFVYLDHVAAFRAIRYRAPQCGVRDTWDQILAQIDSKLQPRFD